MEKGTGVIDIGHTLVLFIVLLFPDDLTGHVIELLRDHLRPLQTIGLDLRVGITLDRHPPCTLLQAVAYKARQFLLAASAGEPALQVLEGEPGTRLSLHQGG